MLKYFYFENFAIHIIRICVLIFVVDALAIVYNNNILDKIGFTVNVLITVYRIEEVYKVYKPFLVYLESCDYVKTNRYPFGKTTMI